MTENEAIEILKGINAPRKMNRKTVDVFNAIDLAIKALEQQPKTGRWITWKEAGDEIPSEMRFECSVCHDAAQTLCNGLDLLSSFCPNCGAKMIESEGEE